MAKKKNNIWKKVLLAGVLVGGYVIYANAQKKTDIPPPVDTTGNDTNIGYPLQYMVYHKDIKLLQKALGVAQDGKIGPQTLHAFSLWRGNINSDYVAADVPDLFETYNDLKQTVDSINSGNRTIKTFG